MIKGTDYFENTQGTEGPIVLVPSSLIDSIDTVEEGEEIYAAICEGNEWLKVIRRGDSHLLRMGENSSPVFWIPRPDGALAVQWQAADSEEQLLKFALERADGASVDEEVLFPAGGDAFYLIDSTQMLLGADDISLCPIYLAKGEYRVTAAWIEGEEVEAILFRFTRRE